MKKLSDMVREIARVGIVNWTADRPQLLRAAKELDEREKRIRKLEMRCEDLEERVAIMAADLKRQEEGNSDTYPNLLDETNRNKMNI